MLGVMTFIFLSLQLLHPLDGFPLLTIMNDSEWSLETEVKKRKKRKKS